MTISYSPFFPATVLGTSVSTLITIAASPSGLLLRGGRIRLANETGAPVTATVYYVPPAGTAGAGLMCFPGGSIGANAYTDVDVPMMIAGSTLQAKAGAAASITATCISGSLFS